MAVHKRISGTSSTMAMGVMLGIVISLIIIIVLSLVLAWLIHSDRVPVVALGYGSMGIIFISALIGSLVAIHRVKRRKLVVATLSGGGLLLALFCLNALLLGGNYQGGFITTSLIILGNVAPVLIGSGRKEKGRRRRFGT